MRLAKRVSKRWRRIELEKSFLIEKGKVVGVVPNQPPAALDSA